MNKKTLILLAALLAAVIITVIVIVVSVSSSGNPSADMTFAAATVEPLPTESPEEVMAYYESYGNVISKTPVMESEKIRTEAEAMAMLLERGFDQYPVSCPLNVDGTGHTEAYEGKWTETDDGIAMNISGYNLYFIRLNENQLYMDLDRLEQDAVDEGAGEMVLLLEALKSIAYMDVGSLFGLFGGFDMDFGFNTYDMMGIDSLDDMFVFTREK